VKSSLSKFTVKLSVGFLVQNDVLETRASAEKFSGGGGGNRKMIPKNSTIKPPSTLSVPYLKIQGGHGLPAPAAYARTRDGKWPVDRHSVDHVQRMRPSNAGSGSPLRLSHI